MSATTNLEEVVTGLCVSAHENQSVRPVALQDPEPEAQDGMGAVHGHLRPSAQTGYRIKPYGQLVSVS